MFDECAFRDAARRNKLRIKDITELLGCSGTSLYRKLSGETEFTRDEIEKCAAFMSFDEINRVFFCPDGFVNATSSHSKTGGR